MAEIIRTATVKKALFGNLKIKYGCPYCQSPLRSEREEIGIVDECPKCGGQFLLHNDVLKEIETDEKKALRKRETASTPKKRLIGIGALCVYIALIYLPLLYWLSGKAAFIGVNQKLWALHVKVDNETKEKISLMDEFEGPKHLCYNCEERLAVKYVTYGYSKKGMGYCGTCTPFDRVSKNARQPNTPEYRKHLRAIADIESAGESEKSTFNKEVTGSIIPLEVWMTVAVLWGWVGGLSGLYVPLTVLKRLGYVAKT